MENEEMSSPSSKETQAMMQFGDAVFRVQRKRHDFGALIIQAHWQLAEKQTDVDPAISTGNLQNALGAGECDLNDPAQVEARLEMVRAVLHIWYRVPPDLQSAVMQAVREFAIVKDEYPTMAMVTVSQVIGNARAAGEATSELQEAMKVKHAAREQAREKKMRQEVRVRFERQAQQGV